MIAILKIVLLVCHGCLGGWTGLQADLKRAQSPEDRQYLIRMSLGLASAILILIVLLFVADPWLPRPWPSVLMSGLLVTTLFLARTDERLTEIESRMAAEAQSTPQDDASVGDSRRHPAANGLSRIVGALGGIIGANSWVFLVFMKTGDWISVGIVVACVCVACVRITQHLYTSPQASPPPAQLRIIAAPLVPLGCIGLLIVYLRAATWQALPTRDLQMVTAINFTLIMMGTIILIADQWQKSARHSHTNS